VSGDGPPLRGAVLTGTGAVLPGAGAGPRVLAAWQADPAAVLSAPRYADAAILVAAAEFAACEISLGSASAVAECGFLAVIATGFGEAFSRRMVTEGVLSLRLPVGKFGELQDIVETRPATMLTADLGNRRVTAGDKFSAIFEVAGSARLPFGGTEPGDRLRDRRGGAQAPSGRAGNDRAAAAGTAQLADRIRVAQRRIAVTKMPADVRIHLQRRLVAVCDAMKAATADPDRCERRLASLTAEVDRLAALCEPENSPDYNS